MRERSGVLERMALTQRWTEGRIVVAMHGYSDESGEHAAQGALARLTLGGFFAPWLEVRALCQEWRDALDVEGLGEFHMKEIASDEHRYSDWPPERQRRLDRFVDIVIRHAHVLAAFSYAPRMPSRSFESAYRLAVHRIFIVGNDLARKSGERGNIVFAKTDEIKAEFLGQAFDTLGWGDWLDGFSVILSRAEPALQAAEIVARGMKRLMQDGVVTHSFGRLISSGKRFETYPFDIGLKENQDG